MGREIRRVPLDWQHPKDGRGHDKPLYDNDYESAASNWEREYSDFMAMSPDERQGKYSCDHYWQYSSPPDEEFYRAEKWTEAEATAYQIYETVTEGTPVSPVFSDVDRMIQWLIDQGYSEHAANEFARLGWVPSMTFTPRVGFRMDIHSLNDE